LQPLRERLHPAGTAQPGAADAVGATVQEVTVSVFDGFGRNAWQDEQGKRESVGRLTAMAVSSATHILQAHIQVGNCTVIASPALEGAIALLTTLYREGAELLKSELSEARDTVGERDDL
jgi:hypothetical protein